MQQICKLLVNLSRGLLFDVPRPLSRRASVSKRFQKRLGSCHVTGRRIVLDENVGAFGKVRLCDTRRPDHDDLANTLALCSIQSGIDTPCIIAATGKTIDRPHLFIVTNAVDRHCDLRTVHAAVARNVKHLAVITNATRVFERGVVIEYAGLLHSRSHAK